MTEAVPAERGWGAGWGAGRRFTRLRQSPNLSASLLSGLGLFALVLEQSSSVLFARVEATLFASRTSSSSKMVPFCDVYSTLCLCTDSLCLCSFSKPSLIVRLPACINVLRSSSEWFFQTPLSLTPAAQTAAAWTWFAGSGLGLPGGPILMPGGAAVGRSGCGRFEMCGGGAL